MDTPHLWIPRCKILEPKREIILPFRLRGRYKFCVHGGRRGRRETPWANNLITNAGLDHLNGTQNVLARCYVGTGNTAPDASDTALASVVASTTTTQSSSSQVNNSSPYEITKTIVKRFAQGVAAGNLAEVGFGPSDGPLFSRALIVDSEGNPTTLTVQEDEFLDVTYQVIAYPPLTDVEDTISIVGSGDHDIVFRAARLGTAWTFGSSNQLIVVAGGDNEDCVAYNGAIGAVTGNPSGSTSNSSTRENMTYTPGSYQHDRTYTFDLNKGNLAGGISATMVRFGDSSPDIGELFFQCSYSPAIPKDGTKTLALNFRCTWGRA